MGGVTVFSSQSEVNSFPQNQTRRVVSWTIMVLCGQTNWEWNGVYFRAFHILLSIQIEAILLCPRVCNTCIAALHSLHYAVTFLVTFELHMHHFEIGSITTKLWSVNWSSAGLNNLSKITRLVRCKVWTCNQCLYSFSICDIAEIIPVSWVKRTQEEVPRWFHNRHRQSSPVWDHLQSTICVGRSISETHDTFQDMNKCGIY